MCFSNGIYTLVEGQQYTSDDHPAGHLGTHPARWVHDLVSVRVNCRMVESLCSIELARCCTMRHVALPGTEERVQVIETRYGPPTLPGGRGVGQPQRLFEISAADACQ